MPIEIKLGRFLVTFFLLVDREFLKAIFSRLFWGKLALRWDGRASKKAQLFWVFWSDGLPASRCCPVFMQAAQGCLPIFTESPWLGILFGSCNVGRCTARLPHGTAMVENLYG